MPCYDPRDSGCHTEYVDRKHNGLTGAKLEAILCGVLTTHGEGLLDTLDYKQIGVSEKQVRSWWKLHQMTDRITSNMRY